MSQRIFKVAQNSARVCSLARVISRVNRTPRPKRATVSRMVLVLRAMNRMPRPSVPRIGVIFLRRNNARTRPEKRPKVSRRVFLAMLRVAVKTSSF